MIHYHGTPITPRERLLELAGRHFCVSYAEPRDVLGHPQRFVFDNVWLGVSIENGRYTWRADVLREIPAVVRFISAEPLLGSLFEQKLRDLPPAPGSEIPVKEWVRRPIDLTSIDWVIIGGESGPGARPFHLEHARELLEACQPEVFLPTRMPAPFVKQMGARPVHDHPAGLYPLALRDRKGGDWDEWPPDLRIREFPLIVESPFA